MQARKNDVQTYSQVFLSSKNYDSKKIYAKRRKSLMEKLDSFCVFAGMIVEPGGEEAFVQTWTRFVQDPAFLYLTGVNQAGCYLVLDPRAMRSTLFVPRKDPFKEFWNGKRLGFVDGENVVARLTGVEEVRPIDELWDFVESLAKKYASGKNAVDHAYAFYYEKFKGDHNEKLKNDLKKVLRPYKLNVKSCADMHFEDRLVLEPERIDDARVAQQITDEAFRALLTEMKNMKTERDVALFLNYEMQRRGDGDLAFPTIIAGGKNACCLHYVKNDEPLRDGELVLFDFGVRFGTLHSDISRTIPVNGKFDPLQKMLYEIVLESAKVYQRVVRPGVALKEIGMICWEFIMMELDRRLVKGAKGSFKLLYDKRPHGVSHFIGEHIHEGDPGSRSLDVVLKPGMLISCEPGLYGDFTATIDGKRYRESIGIRIEDDLIITKSGFENISEHIPRTVEEIEALMK